ncbi:hypothetical protein J1N35_014570 [Gossypium stocksii]|uniref:Aminotransferase-like plant mobile domain-containing protein n=1 Tax=Gossypium stocksii TaxID=47602 RepID=A0A9D3VX97_9ROSI|nr:hypothetical protein J1N35_014570 [Gossypium stocksii]
MQPMDELHKVDLRGKNVEDWKEIHKDYIYAWDRRIEFLPIREPFLSLNTISCLQYMSWFKVFGKLYLLLVDTRTLHAPGYSVSTGTYFRALMYPAFHTPMPTLIMSHMSSQMSPHVPSMITTLMHPLIEQSMLVSIIGSMLTYTGSGTPYTYAPIVSQTLTASLFYQGESSMQPSSTRVEDT